MTRTKFILLEDLDSQGLFLQLLFKRYGGYYAVSRLCGVSKHQPQNWIRQGGVPLKHIQKVSKALKVPPDLLNYRAYEKFSSEPFKNLLKKYNFAPEEAKEILKRGMVNV